MNCPSCQQEMEILSCEKLDLQSCGDCCCVWFSQGQLVKLDWEDEQLSSFIKEDCEGEGSAEKCPDCDLMLHQHKYPTALQVECRECYQCSGVFLTSKMMKEIRDHSMNESQREAYLNNLTREVPGFLEAETVMKNRAGASGFASHWEEFKARFKRK